MAPNRVPPQALEKAQELLRRFRTRTRLEWKAFDVINADEDIMADFLSPNKLELALWKVMETKVRLPCIVCQSHQGVIYCSITYTSSLQTKERIGHTKFLPIFYCVFYPCESTFYTTRNTIPDLISSSFIQAFGGTQLTKLPLEGRDFVSLRQLNHNRLHKGVVFRCPVQDTHPAYFKDELSANNQSAPRENDVIHDEDEPWKRKMNEYYNKHFDLLSDPKISKLTISSSSKFTSLKAANRLQCDLKVTLRSENLLNFFNYSMDRGILSYPLNPYFENIVKIGRTSISINDSQ